MNWMEIVIKIPESTYKYLGELVDAGEEPLGYFERFIMRGTPLPEHHGRLIDADNLKNELQAFYDFYVNAWGEFKNMPNEDKRVADTISQCIAQIVNDPTIIEADKEGSDSE